MRQAYPNPVRDPALPTWVTDDLIARTIATWQPFSSQPLTEDDAVEMLLTVSNLYRVLAEIADETAQNDESA